MSIEPCDTALDRGGARQFREVKNTLDAVLGAAVVSTYECTACDEIGVCRELVQRNICLTFLQQCVFNTLQCSAMQEATYAVHALARGEV